ncbi:uncharacterized protein BDZ99DRAFT_214660 [Mytilinidion resinicola]|uniref:Uncharacterized protein n=1 Tax=Mytilinidion resinicola TaxID=574789 RepID=A0A6A6XZ74_9PEZI|nr:uncharacterized protein BDZ99DRAFT_214660 [Mytilinidion resinicola]KAF2801876.1 hypothetical protein BDZ99DRAFT_214660 [Mytilinidion resinicola]
MRLTLFALSVLQTLCLISPTLANNTPNNIQLNNQANGNHVEKTLVPRIVIPEPKPIEPIDPPAPNENPTENPNENPFGTPNENPKENPNENPNENPDNPKPKTEDPELPDAGSTSGNPTATQDFNNGNPTPISISAGTIGTTRISAAFATNTLSSAPVTNSATSWPRILSMSGRAAVYAIVGSVMLVNYGVNWLPAL